MVAVGSRLAGMHPLVEQAARKASVAWLEVPGRGRAYPVWCLWIDDALYVVSGPGEQPAPGLDCSAGVRVSLRGDHGGRIVTWPAAVRRVEPGGADWTLVASQLAAKRLNAPEGMEATLDRWAAECVVHRLTPAAGPLGRLS